MKYLLFLALILAGCILVLVLAYREWKTQGGKMDKRKVLSKDEIAKIICEHMNELTERYLRTGNMTIIADKIAYAIWKAQKKELK